MVSLNHFAISAALGSTLGPKVGSAHGQIGSSELASTLSLLLQRRSGFVDDLEAHDSTTRKYEKAVTRAFQLVRDGYSPDRVVADPALNRKFLEACRDFGMEDSDFHLNLTLLSLRKNNKLSNVSRSRRALVRDQWRYAPASEVAARVMFYRYGLSVDSLLCHTQLVRKFDQLAEQIAPGFSPFEYRWAALNMRKKGAWKEFSASDLGHLHWSKSMDFGAVDQFPTDEGVYSLCEGPTVLLIAGAENLNEGVRTQRRIAEVSLFEPKLWQPNPQRLRWKFASMPDSRSDERYGAVKLLVARLKPVFNIPRGEGHRRAA